MFHWNRAATADTAADAPRLAELSQESSHPQQSSVERWTGDGISITVEQPPQGFWNSISLWAKVPLPPEEVRIGLSGGQAVLTHTFWFSSITNRILTSPSSNSLFTGI